MKHDNTPVIKDLVLIGGGHSHVTVLKRFGMKPLPGVRITLVCRDIDTPYSGMLPGLIAGHYEFRDTHIDLGPLSRFAGARFFHDEAMGLDFVNKQVMCRDRPPIPYDILSINIGSAPATIPASGAIGNVVPVKPIDQFVTHWQRMRERVMASDSPTRIGVVGGGAGGKNVRMGGGLEAIVDSNEATVIHLEAGLGHPTRGACPGDPQDFVHAQLSAVITEEHSRFHLHDFVIDVQLDVSRRQYASKLSPHG